MWLRKLRGPRTRAAGSGDDGGSRGDGRDFHRGAGGDGASGQHHDVPGDSSFVVVFLVCLFSLFYLSGFRVRGFESFEVSLIEFGLASEIAPVEPHC